jgi:hypothetical protein
MAEKLFPDVPNPTSIVFPAPSRLPPPLDESLFSSASARWRESSQGWRDLVASSPGLRDTFDQLLARELDLDGQQTGLLFTSTDQHPQRFVCFTDACAFIRQHPTLETTLDERCRVSGLKPGHALSALTPLQILERLKALDPERSHAERWRAFWDARSPGTALSRQQHAIQLYRNHFEAAVELAFAQHKLTVDELKPLQLIIDPPAQVLTLDGQPIHTEQLALVLNNSSKIKLTGAWVITTGDATKSRQWLYLPSRPVAIQLFKQRSDLEDWLSRQGLVPTGLSAQNLRFEYTAQTDPMSVGAGDLLATRQQAQVTALRNGTRGKAGMAEHGAQSLDQADQLDRQRGNINLFAAPPRLETTDSSIQTDDLTVFGSLHADTPWSLRQTAVKQQRDAIESLIQDVGDGAGLQPFKDLLKALEDAEQAADNAASALLGRSRTLDLATFQREFTALHDAHKAGLHAEAAVQMALKQLSSDECSLLKAVLDTPDNPGPDAVAASLTLSMNRQDGDKATVSTEELKGVFVITRADTLADAASSQSLLLYWAGSGGGLQRFANRRELEHGMFKANADAGLTLTKITGDALRYGLDQLTSDFEDQAAAIRQRLAEPADAAQRAEQLEALRKHTLATLQVPVHAARNLAFTHIQEQDRSSALASRLPDWLDNMSANDRNELKELIEAYIPAMQRSHALMTVALEPRDDFTRKHLHARLRQDFSLKGYFDVQVDLPNSVTWETQYSSGPNAPLPTTVMVPSATRSTMSLEDLAQLNIDNVQSMQQNALSQRLVFLRLQITATDDKERVRLANGINLIYLRKILPELDLPKAYEQLILDAFKGAAADHLFVKEHRRECLTEPWRLMLKLQGECARLQKQISDDELKILSIATDADTPAAWNADSKRIVLRPARLSAGGKDTPGEGPATLSGVTFIEEQAGGTTLLYLPDSPDGRFLRRYDNLETARKALFNLCHQDSMIHYLSGRALHGDVRAHERRINTAVQKNFDAMIEVGMAWPATTSLAAHLLDAHMGRLIAAHRDTSRSNAALYFERYALEGPRAFNYIKMALGILPFIGTAIALYDAWAAANQAAAAFLRGDVADGVAELKTVLLCLIDAAMDLVPGEAAVSAPSHAARSLTRTRQLRGLASSASALQLPSMRQARHVAARFAGYDYEQPISLAGLQPPTHGIYRNVYRHADGDFIVRQGRIFEVELTKGSRQWRLFGNSRKTYKQPIALDESGNWDTHFGVYGTTFEGGGLGGGNVQGIVADALDPLWPLAIRERLPRWWTDQALRRQLQLTDTADDLSAKILSQHRKSNVLIEKAFSDPSPITKTAAELACRADIALARRRYRALSDLKELTRGNKRRAAIEFQSDTAQIIADRLRHRILYASDRATQVQDRLDPLVQQLNELPKDAINQRLITAEKIRVQRMDMLRELEQIEAHMKDFNHWYELITVRSQRTEIRLLENHREFNNRFSTANMLYLKICNRLESTKNFDNAQQLSWVYLQQQAHPLRVAVDRALYVQFSLAQVVATRSQRNQILLDCLDTYAKFRHSMKAWTTSHPQHFHMEAVEPLMAGIEKMAERARHALDVPTVDVPPRAGTKKVFATEDGGWLIGIEQWEPKTRRRQFTLSEEGQTGTAETWEQTASGSFRLQPRPALEQAPKDLNKLVADARQRLSAQPAYLAKVRSYGEQNMLPIDLEHMMITEADDLSRRADDIEALAAQDTIVAQLRDKASELKTTGRQLRTRQSLISKKPTDGMLDDLVRQNAVDIRKIAPLKNLGKRKDGRTDYMQEYEIHDLTAQPPRLLWFAHFHYTKAAPDFGEFEKAHLKLPEHRFLTHADNADLPYADIGKRSVVLPHFENL